MNVDFEEIYLKYYKSIYKYILGLSKKQNIAEEIAQETFFKALKNIDNYDTNKKMFTWLCQIAKNTYFTEYKKSKKIKELDNLENIIDDETSIIETIIDNETNIEVLKILHKLEEPYKEVFSLRIYCELSFKQIGEIFGKNENWARVTFYRSKIKIKHPVINEK